MAQRTQLFTDRPGVQKLTTLIAALRELRSLRAHNDWSRQLIKEHQEKSLVSLREFATLNSPFYRELYHGLENAPLADLPVLTKSMMMDHFDEFVTDRAVHLDEAREHVDRGSIGRFKDRYEVAATSGSTGNPGIFLFNQKEWATIIASFARAREWAGLATNITKRSKMAVVSSTNDRNMSARVGKTADTPFLPTLRLDATDSMEDIVARLNEWNPDVVVAYASMAYFLAQTQQSRRLAIKPQKVFTSSEVLTEQMRRTIEDAWGDVVFNEFAATETATIAAEDIHHHGMHVFEDLLIVENVDENNKPVPPGEFGDKLLVTVLFSRTQPLIRYEISDSVRFAAEQPLCSLPFSIIDGVQGRREDILTMSGIEGGTVQIHPNVFHDVMDTLPNKGWQIVQEKEGIKVLVVAPSNQALLENKLSAALKEKRVAVPMISIETVEAIPKAKSGKSPLIKAYRSSQ